MKTVVYGTSCDNDASSNAESGTSRPAFGLQFRFTLLVLGASLCVSILVGFLLTDFAARYESSKKREQCSLLASLLARCAADPMERHDIAALGELAGEACSGASVLFVDFYNADGRPLARSGASSGTDVVEEEAPDTTAGPVHAYPVFVPAKGRTPAHLTQTYAVSKPARQIGGPRSLIGYVSVGLDVRGTMRELTAGLDLVFGAVLAVLALAVPLAYFVARRVVLPLNELARSMHRFAAGDLRARSDVIRRDEVGDLARAFNSMADELGRKQHQIMALNTDLEQRVQKRTQQLRELAFREPLTGLYNRRHFNEVLARRFSEALRYSADLSCVMIDLDDFKLVNDQFGHHIGDEVLITLATTITSQLRAADVAARYGGDEFVLLLPQTPAERAKVLAERIAEKFAIDLAERLPEASVTVSIGVSCLAAVGAAEPEALIRSADRAMYRAKGLGKGRMADSGPEVQYPTTASESSSN